MYTWVMNLGVKELRQKSHSANLGLVFCLVTTFFGSTIDAVGQSRSRSQAEVTCGVDLERPAQRVFADPDGNNKWGEYASEDAVQTKPDVGASIAKLWPGTGGRVLILVAQPEQDFAAYTEYCFDRSGVLIELTFALRTAWGWGYRREGPVLNGSLMSKVSEFFSTQTERRIERTPREASAMPEALKTKLYLRKSQLPFEGLLSK